MRRSAPDPGRLTPTGDRSPGAPVVVIGLDGSAASWDAFWWACGEARRLGGRIVVVFVEPITFASPVAENSAEAVALAVSSITVGPAFGTAPAQAPGQQARRLQTETTHHAASQGLDLCFAHVRGDTAAGLAHVAETVKADLVVVGRSAKARHRLAGSVGRRLITRHQTTVVVIVP